MASTSGVSVRGYAPSEGDSSRSGRSSEFHDRHRTSDDSDQEDDGRGPKLDESKGFSRFMQYIYDRYPESAGPLPKKAERREVLGVEEYKTETSSAFQFREFMPSPLTKGTIQDVDEIRKTRLSRGKPANLNFAHSRRRRYYQIAEDKFQGKAALTNAKVLDFAKGGRKAKNPHLSVGNDEVKKLEEGLRQQRCRFNFLLWGMTGAMAVGKDTSNPDFKSLQAQAFQTISKVIADLNFENEVALSNVVTWRKEAVLGHLPHTFTEQDKRDLLRDSSPGELFNNETVDRIELDVDKRIQRQSNQRRDIAAKSTQAARSSPLSRSPYNQPSTSSGNKASGRRWNKKGRKSQPRPTSNAKTTTKENFRK